MKMNKKEKEDLHSYLEEQRAKKLAEIGDYLRHLREQQSLSLEDVADMTKVPARMLNAIEEGNLEPLPEPIYTQGFIKRYADALGLNGVEFANAFPTVQSPKSGKRFWRDLPATQLKPIHLYLFYVLLIILAVTGLSQMVERTPQSVKIIATEKSPPVAKPSPKADKPKSQDKPKLEDKPKSDDLRLVSDKNISKSSEVRVGLTFKDRCWIRVVVDGRKEFEGTLPEGTQRTWTAKQEVIVRAGNAGGVMIAFNDEQAKQLGDPGMPKTVTFKAN